MSRHGHKLYLCSLYVSGIRNVSDNEKFPLYLGDFEILESITVFYCSICLYMPLKTTYQVFRIIFSVICILSSLPDLRNMAMNGGSDDLVEA